MRAAPRTAPTIISIVLLEKFLSGDGGDEEVARGGVISDEELAVLNDFVGEKPVPVMELLNGMRLAKIGRGILDGLEDTIFPFCKKTPFPSSQHG